MGSLVCCATCSCPRNEDTAIGRRRILNESEQLIQENVYTSSSVKISTEYVEKPDGTLLFSKLFEPKNPKDAKAMIFYSIGFAVQTSWMTQDTGVKYAELGFIVFMVEWKGHGKSDGEFMHITDFDTDIVDEGLWAFTYAIHKYIKSNKIYCDQIHKNKNYFLSGASLGGAVTIKIALKSAEMSISRDEEQKYADPSGQDRVSLLQQTMFTEWKGIVLVCPMVAIKKEHLIPPCALFCLVHCCLPCCPRLKLIPNNVKKSLTRDQELQQKIEANPLRYVQSVSLTTAYNLLKATESIELNAKKLKIPMFICHGDDDQLTDCKMSESFYEKCGCQNNDKTIKIYKGRGHALYGETPNVFKDTAQWMMQRVKMD